MPNDATIRPSYAQRFHCIGSACEDTCCQGWTVPIDRDTLLKYQALPDGNLRSLIDVSIELTPQSTDATTTMSPFATVRLNGANQCPMLTADYLCRIHAELGDSLLSHACATYPRLLHSCCGTDEQALALSCPEAARLVLSGHDLLGEQGAAEPILQLGSNENSNQPLSPAASLAENFWPIRRAVFQLLRARTYPLWQRLFLLSLFCRRLDSIGSGELERSVPEFLADFGFAVGTGSLRVPMETLPVDRDAQMDVVLRLAGMMLHKSNMLPRFRVCVEHFTAGIGNGPGATLQSLAAHYNWAQDRFFAPFLRSHPYFLENLLVNTIVRCRFPYGIEAMRDKTQPQMSREFARLAAQFVLMRGLLIGVAGHHGASFSMAHAVHTVQAASKHFEHHPEFLRMAYALLVESRMDGARGLAILLRNAEPSDAKSNRGAIHPNPDVDSTNPSSPPIFSADRPGERPALALGQAK